MGGGSTGRGNLVSVFALACGLLAAPAGAAEALTTQEVASRIVGAALVDSRAYEKLTWLSDRIGHRLSGSEALNEAIEWSVAEFKRDGIERVWTEPVQVPHWVRGVEDVRMVAPERRQIAALALGGSEGTYPDGVTGQVVSVADLDQVRELGEQGKLQGKIVLFNRPIRRNGGAAHGYGSASGLRVDGPSEAALHGAVATMVRSLGTANYRLPHTGMLSYKEYAPKIPAVAIAAEDAERMQRLLDAGEAVSVQITLGCENLPDATSANVIADLPGRERPEEIVLIGAHLDTWDVGDGAHDDGAGVVVVMETLRLLRANGLIPRRTIRAVLFTNEENGLRGGRDYALRHRDELERHVVAIESDAGGFTPLGFGISGGDGSVEIVRDIARHLEIIGAGQVFDRGGGADISRMRPFQVPQMDLRQDTTHYFDYHHTTADTLDKVDRHDLDRNVAAMALMAYMLAEREEPLPRPSLDSVTGKIDPVELTAADGTKLRADFGLPSGRTAPHPAVVLIHEAGSDRTQWTPFARRLLGNGFAVLAYDARGHGESTAVEDARAAFTDPARAPLDLEAALAHLRKDESIDAERLAVIGASGGSGLALVATTKMGARSAVALSGDPAAARELARLKPGEPLSPRSVFHIASESDRGGRLASEARELYELTEPPRKLEIVEGSAAHGVRILDATPALAEEIVIWLHATL